MNLSGRSFYYWMNMEKVPVENTLTIVDDVALPMDKIRLRPAVVQRHNGLKDIESALGSPNYPKLRFGVGNNFPKGMQADYVLGKWFKEEESLVLLKIEKWWRQLKALSALV